MSIAALIVAAGRGSRAGGPQPKQWQGLAGARVIDHTLAAFRALPQITEIVLVRHRHHRRGGARGLCSARS